MYDKKLKINLISKNIYRIKIKIKKKKEEKGMISVSTASSSFATSKESLSIQ